MFSKFLGMDRKDGLEKDHSRNRDPDQKRPLPDGEKKSDGSLSLREIPKESRGVKKDGRNVEQSSHESPNPLEG